MLVYQPHNVTICTGIAEIETYSSTYTSTCKALCLNDRHIVMSYSIEEDCMWHPGDNDKLLPSKQNYTEEEEEAAISTTSAAPLDSVQI